MQLKYKLMVSAMGMVLFTSAAHAANGVPDEVSNLSLDSTLLSTVNDALPESRAVDAGFLDPSYDPVIRLSDDAHVGVSFINEGAGYKNSLGYFTFSDSTFENLSFGDIDTDNSGHVNLSELGAIGGVSTDMIFANASKTGGGGNLNVGDTYVLGGGSASMGDNGLEMTGGTTFSSGTNVGFFLSQNAWNGSGVRGWDAGGDPQVMYSLDFLNPENTAGATLGDPTSDYARHVAMMYADESQEEVILGFEDLNRTRYWGGYTRSDEDFNDAVFLVRTDPVTALSDSNIAMAGEEMLAAPAPALGNGLAGFLGLTGLFGFGWSRNRRTS